MSQGPFFSARGWLKLLSIGKVRVLIVEGVHLLFRVRLARFCAAKAAASDLVPLSRRWVGNQPADEVRVVSLFSLGHVDLDAG